MGIVKYCFVDMDGVLVDFVSGICKVHNRPDPYQDETNLGLFDMDKIWGISARDFWKPTEVDGFWRELPKLPGADELIAGLRTMFSERNICILTSPSLGANCIPEKRAWVENHFPSLSKNILFGSAKRFLAGEDRLLIDDRDENISNWNSYDGVGVLYPQLWNSDYRYAVNPLDKVKAICRIVKVCV